MTSEGDGFSRKCLSGMSKFSRGRELTRRELMALGAGASAAFAPVGWPTFARAANTQGDVPKKGGTLVMALAGDPPTVNPCITTGAPDLITGCLVYEGMVRLEDDFTVSPNLAKAWDVSPDGLRYTFHLVEAKWHDGQDFTSKDVKFTFEEVSSKYGSKFKAAAKHIKSIETPDPRTVVIELNQPFGPFLFSMSDYTNGTILPEHIFKGTNVLQNPASLEKPVGTGPFTIKEWVRGDRIVLERNPNYWREGKPYLDRIVIKEIPDGASRVLALKAGEVDYIYNYFFPPSHYKDVIADPKLQIREQSVPSTQLFIPNLRRPPLDNVKVRQALYMAIDRDYVHKVIYHGFGAMMDTHVHSRLAWAHNSDVNLAKMYPYDPDKANRILDEEGVKVAADGKRFDVRLVFDSADPERARLTQAVAAMWHKIGVRVKFEGSPRNVSLKQVYTDWDFDITMQAYTTAGDPALGISRLYVTSAIQKRPFVNCSGYSNPEVDKLFAAGANSASEEERGKHYKKVQEILARDMPVLPMWQVAGVNAASKNVKGKWAWSTGYSHWEEVWLES